MRICKQLPFDLVMAGAGEDQSLQQMFLQGMMCRRAITEKDALRLYCDVASACNSKLASYIKLARY